MLKNSRGNAMIEVVPVLALFVLIVNVSLGFFGLIHSGILNSIGARNYAFETFRNRADLRYLRDIPDSTKDFTYARSGLRFHTVKNETVRSGNDQEKFFATRRPIRISEIRGMEEELGLNEHEMNKRIQEGAKTEDAGIEEGANPVWIRSTYGICLTATCGGTYPYQ